MQALHKILYVEDAPDIQVIAKMALETIGGFEVLMCSSGIEALEKAHDFEPDLLVLDVMMPNMSGPETLIALRDLESCAEQPAVFVTAKTQPDAIEYYKSIGAVDVIPKPFDPMQLSSQLKIIYERCKG